MKLPSVIKIILNIIFYIIYVLIFSLLFGLIAWFIINYLDKPIIDDNIASIIQLILAALVLFITVVARKYFYISFDKTEEVIEKKSEEIIESNVLDDDLKITIGKNK